MDKVQMILAYLLIGSFFASLNIKKVIDSAKEKDDTDLNLDNKTVINWIYIAIVVLWPLGIAKVVYKKLFRNE